MLEKEQAESLAAKQSQLEKQMAHMGDQGAKDLKHFEREILRRASES